MNLKTYNVLLLCTGNSERKIMAEALLNALGKGRFKAYSAGIHPACHVHPLAIEALYKNGFDTDGLHSKNWNEFSGLEAPVMDFVFTICDKAAGEDCPVWPDRLLTGHWGFENPAAVNSDDGQQCEAFGQIFNQIAARIHAFISLPFDKLDRLSLQQAKGDRADWGDMQNRCSRCWPRCTTAC
jgi:arsenate reductase